MSIIKWIGGKGHMAKKIISLFPKHRVYCEPFFGSGAVFFTKEPSKIEIINDIDDNIVNLFTVIRDKKDEFFERNKYELYSRKKFIEYRETLNQGDDVERAVKFFWVMNQTINGNPNLSGWSTSNQRNYAKNVQDKLEKIEKIHRRLKNAMIDNRDFEKIFEIYDSEETLFFIDPPYIKNRNYYKPKFDLSDHCRLYKCIKNVKGKFLMTIDDSEFIREKYCDFNIIENTTTYHSKHQRVTELIITNYKPSNSRRKIKSLKSVWR